MISIQGFETVFEHTTSLATNSKNSRESKASIVMCTAIYPSRVNAARMEYQSPRTKTSLRIAHSPTNDLPLSHAYDHLSLLVSSRQTRSHHQRIIFVLNKVAKLSAKCVIC